MKRRMRSVLFPSAMLTIIGLLTTGLAWAQEYSHARIVRLSFVEGDVTVQRPDVPDWAAAPVNTPLQEGFKVSTGENSFSEVEFENGSTIRLGQLTLIDFTQLVLAPSGAKINRVALNEGYATFHAMPETNDVYEVSTPDGSLIPSGNSLFRVDIEEGIERVEIFKGQVAVSSNLGSWTLANNEVLELRPGTDQPYTLSHGITKDAWDEWVDNRENQVELAARNAPSPSVYSSNAPDLRYGWNDLSVYGMWSYMPGFGYGWVPRMAAYGWSPYTYGRWSWYPGWGYTWISAEPWGWLPYHYGQWSYVGGFGWAWFPGSFGYWSPALVTWYSGPGWIGWVPRGSVFGHGNGAGACGPAGYCGTAIPTGSFQSGGLIRPGTGLAVNPVQATRIERPRVPPKFTAMLPGPARAQAGATARSSETSTGTPERHVRRVDGAAPASGGGATVSTATGTSAGGRVLTRGGRERVVAPSSSVVFDPAEGRYVNSNHAPAAAERQGGVISTPRTPSAAAPARIGVSGSREPSATANGSNAGTGAPAQTGARTVTTPSPASRAGAVSSERPSAPAQVSRPVERAPAAARPSPPAAPSRPATTRAPEVPRSAPAPRTPSNGGWSGKSSPSAGTHSSSGMSRGEGGFGGTVGRAGGGGGSSTSGGTSSGGGASRMGGTRAGGPHR